jgi:NADH-quinone oxidoreductase subunit L
MPEFSSILWIGLIPIFPLIAAAVIALILFVKPKWHRAAIGAALLGLGISVVISFYAFKLSLSNHTQQTANFTWLQVGNTTVDFGVVLDPLSASMLAMVTLIAFLIFFYSGNYMAEDPNCARFFCYLSLFAAGMLGLVVSNSLILLFMCWEIVGLASYLLIGFWFHKPAAAAAAKKAFITTRIGDLGLFVGMLWAFKETGTLLFYNNGNGLLEDAKLTMLAHLPEPLFGISAIAGISTLIFIGAVGKSGQVPLHVWLPDAMEGPTPVSALIHAATMVAAGVFLVARCYPLFQADVVALNIVAWVGGLTALIAGLIAIGQNDFKRILAYSTVSQLGLMMLGLGLGGVAIGMFHLLGHAFFKALLFLAAGSIIHGCHGEQDIRKLGGVWRSMPVTSACYLVGALALCAVPIPPFSGFFSKDEILLASYNTNPWLFTIAALASLCTSFYMARQVFYVFFGEYRGHEHPHESPWQITGPLVILALFAAFFGGTAKYLGILEYLDADFAAEHEAPVAAIISIAVAVGGLLIGWLVYGRRKIEADATDTLEKATPALFHFLQHRAYFDELYAATVGKLWSWLAFFADLFDAALLVVSELAIYFVRMASNTFAFHTDRVVIDQWSFDGICNGLRQSGFLTSRAQNGFLPAYLRAIALGAVILGLLFWWSLI